MHHPDTTRPKVTKAAAPLPFMSSPTFEPRTFALDADTRILLRPVRPRDRERFASGFASLSNETRYCRCFAHKNRLSEIELDMLCNVDGQSHVAIVAVTVNNAGEETESIGGARYICEHAGHTSAEMAFLITDAWQGRHVGKQMLAALLRHAEQQGVDTLRSYLMPANVKARRLLMRIAELTQWSLKFDEDGALLSRPSLTRCDETQQGPWMPL